MSTSRQDGWKRVLGSQETRELLSDGADIATGALIESEFLGQIPVFGLAFKSYNAVQSARDQVFTNKLARFLQEANQMEGEERADLAEKFEDPKEADRFGETMIILIERAEDPDKPRIFGRLLVACAKGHFDVPDLMRLCKMVNRAISEDFAYLKNLRQGKRQRKNKDVEQSLSTAGFLRAQGIEQATLDDIGSGVIDYDVTAYGKFLVDLGLSEGPVPEYVPAPDPFGFNG
ncbi:hypothetical protein [Halomonas salina]|uniref:Uncharacterized protein n=1 Tax=Halomonas salina TaxID=42565 RepID=A0ABR4WSF5_9GAMM|nr:hypothetical protein [Halomonas salina]KGE77656.1 hypothetical protein FP66_08485 [Halomonas salina]